MHDDTDYGWVEHENDRPPYDGIEECYRKARELAAERPGLELRTAGGPSIGWEIVIAGSGRSVYLNADVRYTTAFIRRYNALGA